MASNVDMDESLIMSYEHFDDLISEFNLPKVQQDVFESKVLNFPKIFPKDLQENPQKNLQENPQENLQENPQENSHENPQNNPQENPEENSQKNPENNPETIVIEKRDAARIEELKELSADEIRAVVRALHHRAYVLQQEEAREIERTRNLNIFGHLEEKEETPCESPTKQLKQTDKNAGDMNTPK